MTSSAALPARPTAAPALRFALVNSAVLAVVLAIVGSVIGALVADLPGLLSALIGAAVSFAFVGLTAGSILLANRLTSNDLLSPIYFAVVLGTWLLKFVLFVAFVLSMRDQAFIEPTVLFVTLVLGVLGSLIIDVVSASRSRVDIGSNASLRDAYTAAMAAEEGRTPAAPFDVPTVSDDSESRS
jgi:hypothetical protein